MADTSLADELGNAITGSKDMDAFDGRLTKVENHMIGMEKRLDTVEGTLSVHGSKLDQIITVVTRNEASRGPGWGEIVRTGSNLATALAIISGLLIYIIASVMSTPFTRLDERQSAVIKQADHITGMRIELALTKEKLLHITNKLDLIENVMGWKAKIASTR